ncbi:glycosyltransferase family 2 protein [Chitinophaga sancti]|uniref:Glycosyl transferase family 2 n=1 Tax=Chitinophaga sancti TaxID=1004 RepID=A0A1K1S2S3_9BACT|nr:glycosyltransferase family 2 protein [Chitinophaga sancti]WQD59661.1 glycosyltransferase family 2 protein [Chitinophaga sancti]WQG88208.1 glycosyltransferase family 2 protein [Chitinophaga sancti]SFW78396.1 Glycosyl transferase family 2 [Chitinophaga sancti]
MINGKKILVVLPAYNAGKTLKITYDEIDRSLVDDVILVDDASKDNTVAVAKEIGIVHIICHEKNKGYGGNQKSCYKRALELGADIIIMLHPDYQYTPLLIEAMASIIAKGVYPVVLGSRILGRGALKGGMPYYKYFFNRFLTISQNTLMRQKLSEYHTGYRAFDRSVLEAIPWESNSDDFVFDNEMLGQICYKGFDIAEVTCPTKYFEEASSINFRRSAIYGMGVLAVSMKCFLQRMGLAQFKLFDGITPELHGRGKKQFLPPTEKSNSTVKPTEKITTVSSHS